MLDLKKEHFGELWEGYTEVYPDAESLSDKRFVEEESLLRMGRRASRLLAAADAADRRATT